MSGMALSRTAPPRALALVSAAAAGGTALAGAGPAAHAAAAQSLATRTAATATATATHAAASTLITVTVDSVPALSVNAFQGTYATSTVAQNGGDDSADSSQDPTGVLDRITLDQPAQSKTHSDPAKNWADAQPAVEYTLHGKKLYAISSVDAHAECVPSSAQGANTYVHTAPDSVTVLGTKVGTGKTTLPVTGAQLGVASVDHGSLEVAYSTTAMQGEQADAASAHAHMDLSISGVFYDSAGKQLYSGPLQKLRLGDVQVACQSSGTVTTPTPTPTTGSSAPGSPSVSVGDPQTPGPAAPSTLRDARDPAAYVSPPRTARHGTHPKGNAKGEPGPAAPENGPALPAANVAKATASDGGDGSLWWALLSVLGLGGGAGLYFATRRRGRHQ
jgi:hypothetical protein